MRCNIKERVFNLVIVLIVLLPHLAHADVVSETMQGKVLLFQRDYPAALELFRKIERDYPDSVAGIFGQMASYQIMMYENLDYRYKLEYEEIEKRFEQKIDKMLAADSSSWSLFMAGAAYGMRGFYYMRDDRWFRALGSAIKGIRLMKRALFKDPAFIDAKLGLGMYNYWRTVYTREIIALPFFPDHRKEGMQAVLEVVNGGLYGVDLAEANMAFIYAQEKKYKKSREIVDKFLGKYPANIILRQLSARLYFTTRQYDKAIAEYKKVMEIDPVMTKSLYYIGYVLMQRHETRPMAVKYFEDFLATNPEKHWARYARKNLERLQTIQKS